MQTFNPASTSLIFGVLGLKLFFYYVPLLFVGYALLNSEEQLRRFFFREHHPRLDHWLSRNCAIHSGTYVFESRAAGRGNTRAEHELSCFTDLWSVVISSHLCVRQHRALRQLHARFLALGCRISGLPSLA